MCGAIKAENRLSLGNAYIAATALIMGGSLVHKDPEFEQLTGIVQIEPLPYKVKKKLK